MATWADAGLVALGGAIGVGGTFGASWLGRQWSREDQEEAGRKAQVERVAEVVGRVQLFLVDANPMHFLMDVGVPEVHAMAERWQPLREQLAVLAAKEPASELRDAMHQIDVQVANLLPGLMWIVSPDYRRAVRDAEEGITGEKKANRITEEYEAAQKTARRVLELVHGEGNGESPDDQRRREEAEEA
jgi:hypothetical protein